MADIRQRNADFLNAFWDLASDEKQRRVKAGSAVVNHLLGVKISNSNNNGKSPNVQDNKNAGDSKASKKSKDEDEEEEDDDDDDEDEDDEDDEEDEEEGKSKAATTFATPLSDDIQYALKRLVRGLASSRESARQGFAACLSEVLVRLPHIRLRHILVLIEEHTKITGSLKGGEERDMLFGKLFGYLAVIRSGRIDLSADASLEGEDEDSLEQKKEKAITAQDHEDATPLPLVLFDKLFKLYNHKGWMREVISEAFLFLLNESPSRIVRKKMIPLLKPLLVDSLADMSASQLALAMGLEFLATSENSKIACKKLKKEVKEILPAWPMMTPENLDIMKQTLISSTAGFPKIHRVWDFVLGSIFPLTAERLLPSKR